MVARWSWPRRRCSDGRLIRFCTAVTLNVWRRTCGEPPRLICARLHHTLESADGHAEFVMEGKGPLKARLDALN